MKDKVREERKYFQHTCAFSLGTESWYEGNEEKKVKALADTEGE